jgi:aminoglycoside phosphotransferase (APT) family kinase protein
MNDIEEFAREITQEILGVKTASIQRFPTGLSHFVFDVSAENGFSCVIRIARPERTQEFERGIKWHAEIESLGVRLPQIYEVGEINDHHFAVYERLMGDDLENLYPSLSAQEVKRIAEEVAEIQRSIQTLDKRLFGRTNSWEEVLRGVISRSEREILWHGLCDPKYIDLILEEIEKHAEDFHTIEPVAFLYDLSVRNVIIFNGNVTGIIDVDDVWYGDPLLAIGRGKTILLAMRQDTDFINHWCAYLELTAQEMRMVELYSLLYCLRFMGTIGTKLNGNASIQTNPENARLFESLADNILNA